MTDLSHGREQFPVGQGFFHAGYVSKHGTTGLASSQQLSYVYDCGAVPAYRHAREREISAYKCRREPSVAWDEDFNGRLGWLGTGDADLRSVTRLNALLQHYGQLIDDVGTLTIPHHASDHNSDSALLRAVRPDRCVAACDTYRNWRHPGIHICAAIGAYGVPFRIVTSREDTRFTESVWYRSRDDIFKALIAHDT